MTASKHSPLNCQSRLVPCNSFQQMPWHDRGSCTLEQAAIAEAKMFLGREKDSVIVQVRHSDTPDIMFPLLKVVRYDQYRVEGLRGGDHE
jgi:hypothetical protein